MALTLNRSCTSTVDVAAPIDVVWELISDITRVGEWSVECRSCEWIGGASGPAVGARFRGRNRRNASWWTRTCEVLAAEAPNHFVWRTLPTRVLPDSTEWSFDLEEHGGRTRLTESMRILHIPRLYERVFAIALPQHRDRTSDLQGDLRRISHHLETAATHTTGPSE